MMPKNHSFIFVVNSADFFLSHRKEIASALLENGNTVHVACPASNNIHMLVNMGVIFHEVPFKKGTVNILDEFIVLVKLFMVLYKVKPYVVHSITIKAYVYAGILSRFLAVPCNVAAVAGLGHIYSSQKLKMRLIRFFIRPFMRFCFSNKKQIVIFQNSSDLNTLLNQNIVSASAAKLIQGSGVDVDKYNYLPPPEGNPTVCLASRLVVDKGIRVYVEAIKILIGRGVSAEFLLAGDIDADPTISISCEELEGWEAAGYLKYLGFRSDISQVFQNSNIVVLPSFYGEGLPKVLLEAAACGRPVVTTDHPGCRDAIINNSTGLLVPVRDPVALASAMEYLILNDSISAEMGAKARTLALSKFTVDSVVEEHMKLYSSLINTYQ